MSKNTRFLLISLPASISPSNNHDEALTALRSAVTTDYGTVFPFSIPEFKIGTLDALVQQADELAKLEAGCEAVVGKVGDSLRTILEGDEGKIAQQKTVNDSQSWSLGGIGYLQLLTQSARTRRTVPEVFPLEQNQISGEQASGGDNRYASQGITIRLC